MKERLDSQTLEARTEELFSKSVEDLAVALVGQEIVDGETGNRILVAKTEAWTKERVGTRYSLMNEKKVGTYYAFYFPLRRMTQTLIVARSNGEVGACVRVLRAKRYDEAKGEFVDMAREGDTAEHLRVGGDKESGVGRLAYVDETDTLYLLDKGLVGDESSSPKISPEEADRAIDDLVNGE